jgi:acetylglutamate kinase
VRDDPSTALDRLTPIEAQAYLDDDTFEDGMRPKIRGALEAIAAGAKSAVVCGAGAGVLSRALRGDGTIIAGG